MLISERPGLFSLRILAVPIVGILAGLSQPISAATPSSQFTWSPDHPTAGQPVHFRDLSTNAPTSWSWTFGDGGASTAQNPVHVFATGGQYRVKLTVSNASGHSLGEHTVSVQAAEGTRPTPIALSDRPVAPIAPSDSVSGCDYYASPAGGGSGRSLRSPFQVADFWPLAGAGKTLCLADGVYADPRSMITPPSGLSGVQGSPITIKAIHDGGALVTGQAARQPILLISNDWMVVEGVNACCSSGTVVGIGSSSNDVLRRIAAWDAAEGNYDIFGIHYSDHNLLEDVAGWGIARKIYESSQAGNFTTVRRGWGRWEGSHVVGPKMVYSLAYNNYDMLVENSLGTWSGEGMKESYVLLDYNGQPWTGAGGGTYTNHDVNQPYAIFAIDALEGDKNARARLLGSLAYVGETDVFKAGRLVFVANIDSVEIKDTAAAYEPGGSYADKYTFGLYGLTTRTTNGGETNVQALNLTSLDADSLGDQIGDGWQQSNVFQGTDLAALPTSGSAYPGTQGANSCLQYVDGTLTDRPLWPWPMNDRIRDAMVQSGHAPVDVTQTVERIFGSIPSGCRSIDLLLPLAAHVDGPDGTPSIADLAIYNPSSETARARLIFQPAGSGPSYSVNLQIPAGETLNARDAVRSTLGLDTAIGSLRLQSDGAAGQGTPRASGRISVARGEGTMGTGVGSVAVPAPPTTSSAYVTGLSETGGYQSTLGAVNPTGATQIFKIVLRSHDGSVLFESPELQLEPGLTLQWPIANLYARASGSPLTAEFQPQSGTTTPIAYGIVTDTFSEDPGYRPAALPVSTLYLPAVGNLPGGPGDLTTELFISNVGDSSVTVEPTLLDHDGSNASPVPVPLTLAAHETRRIADPLSTLFRLSQGYGAVELSAADGSASLVAAARAFAASPSTPGTVGQQVNAVSAPDLRSWGSLLGLEEDGSFRSIVTFVNPATSAVSASLELRDAGGTVLSTQTLEVPPLRLVQRSLTALFPDASIPSNAALTFSFTSGAPIFAFGSVSDQRTGDPTSVATVP